MHMSSRDGGDSGPNVRPPCSGFELSLSSNLEATTHFASSFSNLEWLQQANVDTKRPLVQNIISYDKDTKFLP